MNLNFDEQKEILIDRIFHKQTNHSDQRVRLAVTYFRPILFSNILFIKTSSKADMNLGNNYVMRKVNCVCI